MNKWSRIALAAIAGLACLIAAGWCYNYLLFGRNHPQLIKEIPPIRQQLIDWAESIASKHKGEYSVSEDEFPFRFQHFPRARAVLLIYDPPVNGAGARNSDRPRAVHIGLDHFTGLRISLNRNAGSIYNRYLMYDREIIKDFDGVALCTR